MVGVMVTVTVGVTVGIWDCWCYVTRFKWGVWTIWTVGVELKMKICVYEEYKLGGLKEMDVPLLGIVTPLPEGLESSG